MHRPQKRRLHGSFCLPGAAVSSPAYNNAVLWQCGYFLRNNFPFQYWLTDQLKYRQCKCPCCTLFSPTVFVVCTFFYRAASFENICTTAIKSTTSLAIYLMPMAFSGLFAIQFCAIPTFFWRFVDKLFKACFHIFHGPRTGNTFYWAEAREDCFF